ncbi:ParA family protein [Streptomyces chrestomyceticus]|uniref:ParA family protein n=1 Tax=Streptomyces chrestomyceticus TaxID=68185 RepID=UPI00340D41A0
MSEVGLRKTTLAAVRDLRPRKRLNPLILAMVLAAGGTAKTTSTTILGTILALRGYIVRIFDLDPQCNTSEILGRREEHKDPEQKTVWDLIQGLCTLDEATVQARYRTGYDEEGEPLFTEIPNLYLVHGDSQLTDTDTLLANKPQKFNWFYNLTGLYAKGELAAHEREVWLLDLPANYGKLTLSTLIALTEDDEVIPPLLVTGKESGALEKLLRTLLEMQREFSGDMAPASPTVKNVLLCSTPTSSHNAQEYHDTVAEVERDYPGMVLPYVRHSGVTAKQYRRQVTPPISDPKSAPSVDYEKVADALGFPDLEPAA